MEMQQLLQVLGPWSAGRGALYRQLATSMQAAIQRGDIAPLTRLPAERVLAQALAVSRTTVLGAYRLLEQEGWVDRLQGSGTWVRSLPLGKTYVPPIGLAAPNIPWHLPSTQQQILIDLSVGTPGPLAEIAASDFALTASDIEWVMAQRSYSPQGWLPLCQEIASYLSRCGLPTSAHQILVTTGAQQAIALIAQLYVQRGEVVALENPTYFGAIDIFRGYGAQLAPLSVGDRGIQLPELRELCKTTIPRLLYLTPTFQNPTGTLMPTHARQEIARLVAETRMPLLEDMTFVDVRFGEEDVPPPIASFCRQGPVLAVGSLDKMFWSGLRIGWIRAAETIIERLLQLKERADLGTGLVSQAIALRVMQRIEQIRAARQRDVKERLAAMEQLLAAYLPSWQWRRPAGGYFGWLRLPAGNAQELAQLALRHGVLICPGSMFSVDGTHQSYVRLPFLVDTEIMQEGIARLASAWQAYELSLS
ncbi:PLP-dependent aminotransferase family protein [Ktedonosporobacter rubrisoli]|nr:PLP-dependent aminotransferase family protein [Ktedonosporobacter rubrisoli]